MNQFTNVTLLFLTFPILLFCIFIGYDLPLEMLKTTGAQLPYTPIITWVMASLVFLLLAKRSAKRWYGLFLLKQTKRFVYNVPVSDVRKKRVVVYNLLESFVLLTICLGIFYVYPKGSPIYLAYGLGVVDGFLFSFFGVQKKAWRLGITSKAIVLADREVAVVYFYGLRKIHTSHDTIYFDYVGDLKLSLPLIAAPIPAEFVKEMLPFIDKDKVYLDASIKNILT